MLRNNERNKKKHTFERTDNKLRVFLRAGRKSLCAKKLRVTKTVLSLHSTAREIIEILLRQLCERWNMRAIFCSATEEERKHTDDRNDDDQMRAMERLACVVLTFIAEEAPQFGEH